MVPFGFASKRLCGSDADSALTRAGHHAEALRRGDDAVLVEKLEASLAGSGRYQGVKPKSAFGPSRADASGHSVRRSCAFGYETRGFCSVFGCSVEKCVSSAVSLCAATSNVACGLYPLDEIGSPGFQPGSPGSSLTPAGAGVRASNPEPPNHRQPPAGVRTLGRCVMVTAAALIPSLTTEHSRPVFAADRWNGFTDKRYSTASGSALQDDATALCPDFQPPRSPPIRR